LHAVSRRVREGGWPGGDEVRAAGRPHQSRFAEGAYRRLLAELSDRGRRHHAVVRRGAVAGRAVARGELREVAREAMSTINAAPRGPQTILGLLVLAGAAAFIFGIMQPQPVLTWAIYLVNLLFWSSLAITGPAIAGMIQVTEGRWSPTVKRMAVTTVGFLPVSFILFLVLFAGRAALYPWVTHPVEKKVAWLNVPFMAARIGIGVLLLYWAGFALARAVFSEHPLGADGPTAIARRNRISTVMLILYVVVLSLWAFDL